MSRRESSSPVGPPRRPLAYWPGMLLAPSAFLAYLSIAFALVPYACQSRQHGWLHGTSLVAVAIVGIALLASLRDWRRDAGGPPDRRDVVASRRRFLAHLALSASALALLATLTLWFTQFVVPPCAG